MAVTTTQKNEPAVDPTTGGQVPPATPPDPAAFAAGATDAPATGAPQQQPPAATAPPEGDPAGAPAEPGRTFTEEDIAKARREEKDKLYPEISGLKSTVEELRAKEEARERAAQEEAARLAQEAEAARLAELTALERVEEAERRMNERLAEIEAEREQERALMRREQEFHELQQYIVAQQRANEENILPELLDLITGNTREEVDASVSTLVARSEGILQNVTAAQGGQPPATAPRGASVTAPPVGPSDNNSGQRTFTAEEIAAMPMDEYAKHRAALLQGNSQQVRERGLYG